LGRNEIRAAPVSSALLRIACLVILYKTCVFRTKNSRPMGYHEPVSFSLDGVQPAIQPIPGTNNSLRSSPSRLTASMLFSHEL
jgi:hypothetical protein